MSSNYTWNFVFVLLLPLVVFICLLLEEGQAFSIRSRTSVGGCSTSTSTSSTFIQQQKVMQKTQYLNRKDSSTTQIYSSEYNSGSDDSNRWQSSDILPFGEQEDWEDVVNARQDGSLWSSFTSDDDDDDNSDNNKKMDKNGGVPVEEIEDGEAWLDAIAKISADEIDFINVEADRADKVRQMQEMEFSSEAIAATLGVEMDESREVDPENEMFEKFKEETSKTGFGMYVEEEYDMETVESHTTVEIDEETGEPVRTQMVYVDEHTCIGCTHCAMIAQSTFFMEPELGRARVFEQWGDDDETIEIAIETCPVDCIHYVPYDELKRLEIDRRDQRINFKARLVNQGEYGGGTSHNVGGGTGFTPPQEISGNMKPRCGNCPTLGCKDCPMFGVGKNPYFEKKEAERKLRMAKRRMKQEMENSERSADL